jgi:hypothetical protein
VLKTESVGVTAFTRFAKIIPQKIKIKNRKNILIFIIL